MRTLNMKRLRWWRKPEKPSDEADVGRFFAALRKHAPHDSFPAVQDWITHVAQDANVKRQRQKMPVSPMKTFLNTYKTRLVVSSFILAVTIISCTTPVEHEETIGHMVSGVIEGAHATAATQQLSKLDWIQSNKLELGLVASKELHEVSKDASDKMFSPSSQNHRFVIALPQTGEAQANGWAYELKLIEGIKEVVVTPLQVTSEKPVYKVVLNSIWDNRNNLEFNPDQQQLNRAIEEHLDALEMHGVEVKQIQDEKGNYILSLTPPDDIKKPGLSTLKQFLSEVAPPHPAAFDAENPPSEKFMQDALNKLKELDESMEQMEAGPGREKMETYKKQLEAKLDALKKVEKN